MNVEPLRSPVARLTRGETAAILGVAIAIFLWAAGPIWLHRWEPDTSILISYVPLPILVFSVLLARGRFGLKAFLAETLRLGILKFGITAGFLIFLWSTQSPPKPASVLAPVERHLVRVRWPRMTAVAVPATTPPPSTFAPGSLGEAGGVVWNTEGKQIGGAVVFVQEGLEDFVFRAPAQVRDMPIGPDGIIPNPLVLQRGERVAFRSADGRLHTLHAWFRRGESLFNVPVLPDAVPREIVFPLAGSGWIRCEVHPAESAPLLVAPGPFIARTGADGAFLIPGIPAGALRLGVFHAGRVAGVRRLLVVAGARTDGSIQILPATSPDR